MISAFTRVRMSSRLLLAVGAIALLVTCPVAAHADAAVQGIGVAPLRVDVDVKAGGASRVALTVMNTTNASQTFTFDVVDIQGDKDDPAATPIVLGGEVASSISGHDWITAPAAITVAAGDQQVVYAGIHVPTDAKGGHYAAVTVTSKAFDMGTGTVASRIAVPFLMNAGGVPPPQIKVTEVKDYTDGGTKVVYVNGGQTDTTPHGRVTYNDPLTGKKTKGPALTCSTALPGGSGVCTTDSKSNGSGSGSGSSSNGTSGGKRPGLAGVGPSNGFVELVTDEGTRARGDVPTQWAGTWTSMLLPVAGIVLFVMYFLFLRRRRKDRVEGGDEELAFDGMD